MAEESRRVAVFDASSAILFYKALEDQQGVWSQLAELFHLIMPIEVWREITRNGYVGAAFFATRRIFRVIAVDQQASEPLIDFGEEIVDLDRGEQAAIRLYLSGQADFMVTDDRKAAKFCKKYKIAYANALLLPRFLSMAGCLEQATGEIFMQRLMDIGRYSKKIKDFARYCPDRDLQYFLPRRSGLIPTEYSQPACR